MGLEKVVEINWQKENGRMEYKTFSELVCIDSAVFDTISRDQPQGAFQVIYIIFIFVWTEVLNIKLLQSI